MDRKEEQALQLLMRAQEESGRIVQKIGKEIKLRKIISRRGKKFSLFSWKIAERKKYFKIWLVLIFANN